MLPNILRNKGNQTVKFDQLIEYNKINIFFFKKYAENGAMRLVLDLFLFFEKRFYEVQPSVLQLSFNYFEDPQLGIR